MLHPHLGTITMRYNLGDFEFTRALPAGKHPKGKAPPKIKQTEQPSLESAGAERGPAGGGSAVPGGGGNGHNGNGHGHGHDGAAWISQLAQACRQFWRPGMRHHLALALAGLLRNSGVEELEAMAVMRAIAVVTGDDETDDRFTAVQSTYAMPRERVSGTKGIQQLLGIRAKDFFHLYNEAIDKIEPKPLDCPGFPEFDPYKCYPAGSFFDEFISYTKESSDAPVQFLAASIITMVAGALGNKSYIYPYYGYRRLYPNLYTMLIAPPERYRKSESIRFAKEIALLAKTEEFPNDSTVEAWHVRMAPNAVEGSEDKDGNPTQWEGKPEGILCYSEFSRFLTSTTKGHMVDIKPFLTDLYDGGSVSKATKKNGKYRISNASISVLAGVTPAAMRQYITSGDIGDGFLSRWMLVMKPKDWQPDYSIAQATLETADKINGLGARLLHRKSVV